MRLTPVQRGDILMVGNLPSLTSRQKVAMDIARREQTVFGRKMIGVFFDMDFSLIRRVASSRRGFKNINTLIYQAIALYLNNIKNNSLDNK